MNENHAKFFNDKSLILNSKWEYFKSNIHNNASEFHNDNKRVKERNINKFNKNNMILI